MSGTPGSIAVVRIPVPAALRQAGVGPGGVAYRIEAGPLVRVIGETSGDVPPVESTLRVTLNVLRNSQAGRALAATVQFIDTAGRTFAVPVEVDVASQRSVQLSIADAFVGGVRGTWTAVRYEIHNAGNTTEQVALTSVLPNGWRSASDELRGEASLAPSDTRRGTIRLWIPPEYPLGQSVVRLFVTTAGATRATGDVYVNVTDARAGTLRGPQLALSAIAASTPSGELATGYQASVSGAIADSVFVSARASVTNATDGAATYGLVRAGAGYGAPMLDVRSPRVDATLGALGLQQSELSGFFLNGLGARSLVRTGALSIGGFVSRPMGFSLQQPLSTSDGRFVGAEIARRAAWGGTRVQGVSLRDGVIDRRLDAVSLSTDVTSLLGGRLVGELGLRSFADGSGVGVSSAYRRAMGGTVVDLRVMHAPGGSRAFARASNDVSGSLSTQLGRAATLALGGWDQRDDNATIGRLVNNGWFVNPMMNVRPLNASVGLEARGSAFSSANAGGRFENTEQQLAALVDAHIRSAYVSTRVGYGRLTRTIDLSGSNVPNAEGRRLETRVAGGVMTGAGQFELLYISQQYSGVPGLFPQQSSVAARLDRLRVPFLSMLPLYLNADAQRFIAGSSGVANWAARGGVSTALPGSLGGVSFQAEYNPFILGLNGGRNGLLYTLRLDRTIGLPRFGPSKDQRLFTDVNGNGVWDRGERGVPRVVVECGPLTVVTDADGRFACPAGTSVQVDARTVPLGLLAPPTRAASARRGDIALRPVHSRTVRLFVAASDSNRVRRSDLAQAIVIARDSAGTAWVARSRGDGEFTFDALPPGTYQLEVDASAISEPLRAVPVAPLIIGPEAVKAPVEIEMKPREIRVKQLGNRSQPANRSVGRTEAGSRTNQRMQQ